MSASALPFRFAPWMAMALALVACADGGGVETPTEPAVTVVVAPPRPAATSLPVPAIGRLERTEESTLGFLAGGVVDRIEVDIGDVVRKGQVLATQTPTAVDAALAQAQQQQAQAVRDEARAAELVRKQLVARQVLDDARTRLAVAEAQQRSAAFAARNARLLAPVDGVVVRRFAEPGEVVAAGTPVLALSGGDAGWQLRATVADRDGVRLKLGDPATLRIDAVGGVDWPARIARMGGEADAASGGITVDLALLPPEDADTTPLRSGLVAQARIAASGDAALTVPASALIAVDDGRGRIMVVREGRAVPVEVKLGEVGTEAIRVLSGLSVDDAVVVEGAAYLAEGTPVAIVGEGAP
jgi:multidrug efflux system membrane fusion protein